MYLFLCRLLKLCVAAQQRCATLLSSVFVYNIVKIEYRFLRSLLKLLLFSYLRSLRLRIVAYASPCKGITIVPPPTPTMAAATEMVIWQRL